MGSTTLRSKVGRTQCGPERERGTSGCPQPRAIPLSPSITFLTASHAVSVTLKIGRARDVARSYQFAVPDRGFEPSKMKQAGFDTFAEQSWTHAVRSRT